MQLVGGNPNAPIVPNGKNNLVYFLEETKQADIFLSYYTSGKTAQVNLSLVITKVPEPSISGLLLVSSSCLMVYKLRRNRQLLP